MPPMGILDSVAHVRYALARDQRSAPNRVGLLRVGSPPMADYETQQVKVVNKHRHGNRG